MPFYTTLGYWGNPLAQFMPLPLCCPDTKLPPLPPSHIAPVAFSNVVKDDSLNDSDMLDVTDVCPVGL
jgi:hypothetical protein